MEHYGYGIRDDTFGSAIRDKHPRSATLPVPYINISEQLINQEAGKEHLDINFH
jgi:hypothetical protein